ncbi:MAG: alpha/beta family hydrolase [Vicinamibacterales bacterium]
MATLSARSLDRSQVHIHADLVRLDGELAVPESASGIVVFAHGSGSTRHSPRNKLVADTLNAAGLATLLFDLLTEKEAFSDAVDGHLRFDIPFLATRLEGAIDWLTTEPATRALKSGVFGASTGAGAALVAAAERPDRVSAVVSRGGRPDLAGTWLRRVTAPTLLIVGSHDEEVVNLNRWALARLPQNARLTLVPGATHLFEEPGTLEQAAELARDWFLEWLKP